MFKLLLVIVLSALVHAQNPRVQECFVLNSTAISVSIIAYDDPADFCTIEYAGQTLSPSSFDLPSTTTYETLVFTGYGLYAGEGTVTCEDIATTTLMCENAPPPPPPPSATVNCHPLNDSAVEVAVSSTFDGSCTVIFGSTEEDIEVPSSLSSVIITDDIYNGTLNCSSVNVTVDFNCTPLSPLYAKKLISSWLLSVSISFVLLLF